MIHPDLLKREDKKLKIYQLLNHEQQQIQHERAQNESDLKEKIGSGFYFPMRGAANYLNNGLTPNIINNYANFDLIGGSREYKQRIMDDYENYDVGRALGRNSQSQIN